MQVLFAVAPSSDRAEVVVAEAGDDEAPSESGDLPEITHERGDEVTRIGARDDDLAMNLANYIAELALQDYRFVTKKVSLTAVSIVAVARAVVLNSEVAWNSTLAEASGYEWGELQASCKEVWKCYRRAVSSRNRRRGAGGAELLQIHRRYRDLERREVAHIVPPRTLPMRWYA